MDGSAEILLEKYRQKVEIFLKLRYFRDSLFKIGLLRSQAPKCTVLDVEHMWISIFGTTSISCDMLQFIHAIDTVSGWPEGASLKDKALLFKLISAKSGECSFQTVLESPLCFVPFVVPFTPSKKMLHDNEFIHVVNDVARSCVYRKVDLLRLDLFGSTYISAEEIQIITPRTYRLNIIKAAVIQILSGFCEENNLALDDTTIRFAMRKYGATLKHLRSAPGDGPWALRYLLEAAEIWDRNVVVKTYLNDRQFQVIYKQITEKSKALAMQLKGLSSKEEAKLRALQNKESLRMAQVDSMVEQELKLLTGNTNNNNNNLNTRSQGSIDKGNRSSAAQRNPSGSGDNMRSSGPGSAQNQRSSQAESSMPNDDPAAYASGDHDGESNEIVEDIESVDNDGGGGSQSQSQSNINYSKTSNDDDLNDLRGSDDSDGQRRSQKSQSQSQSQANRNRNDIESEAVSEREEEEEGQSMRDSLATGEEEEEEEQ